MRSHNEAARMMGDRSRAAFGIVESKPGFRRVEVRPDLTVRAMLADLVPFEELDSVMGGIAASADNVTLIACRLFDVDGESEEAAEFAFSSFIAVGQEITYALLMAGADGGRRA